MSAQPLSLDVLERRTLLSGAPPTVEWMRFNFETEQSITVQFTTDVGNNLNSGTVRVTDLGTGQVVPWCLFFPRIESGPGEPTRATWKYFGGVLDDGNYRADVLGAGDVVEASHDFFTLAGDANHDGEVNFDDYVLIDQGFNSGQTGYSHGDFNYDGVVDFDDYTIIDQAFNN